MGMLPGMGVEALPTRTALRGAGAHRHHLMQISRLERGRGREEEGRSNQTASYSTRPSVSKGEPRHRGVIIYLTNLIRSTFWPT